MAKQKHHPTGTENRMPVHFDMDFCTGMPEAKQATGDSWHRVVPIVQPSKLVDSGVKERCPSLISNAWSPKRDTADIRAFR